MNKQVAIIITALCVVLFSCKKENTPVDPSPAGPPANSKVKTRDFGGTISEFTYNADGSINKVTSNGRLLFEYQYSPGKVTSFQYLADGSVGEKVNMTLNADGLVTDYQSENFPTTVIKYEYNADKSLKAKKNYDNGILSTITLYTFKDGNLVKDSTFSAGGAPAYSRTYEFFTDKISTTENSNTGMAFWKGFDSKNAKKQAYSFNDATGAITLSRSYQQPELDVLNRIKKVGFQDNGATVYTFAYTYY